MSLCKIWMPTIPMIKKWWIIKENLFLENGLAPALRHIVKVFVLRVSQKIPSTFAKIELKMAYFRMFWKETFHFGRSSSSLKTPFLKVKGSKALGHRFWAYFLRMLKKSGLQYSFLRMLKKSGLQYSLGYGTIWVTVQSGLWRVWVTVQSGLRYSLGYGTVWVAASLGSGSLGYGTVWDAVQSGLWWVWVTVQSGLCHSLGCGSLGCGESGLWRVWVVVESG